jgi:hypothetical protein
MDAKERFKRALAERAHGQLLATGWNVFFFDRRFDGIQSEVGASDNDVRIAVTALEDEFLLTEQQGHHRATVHLALLHEEHVRTAAYEENQVRRVVLRETTRAEAETGRWASFSKASADRLGFTFERLRAAARVLDGIGCLELGHETNGSFICEMRSRGHELMDGEALLRASLPVSVGEDQEALPAVVPDVLKELILSCEQLLQVRRWTNALDELRRADQQYAKEDWVNAVREYYSALESGLKYALQSEGDSSDNNALRSLARQASERGLIPTNYQAVFGFLDSIRSPRSHGAGPVPKAVEVNQPEALLMGNLARALIVYLGNRTP